jgi:hypothetical protein
MRPKIGWIVLVIALAGVLALVARWTRESSHAVGADSSRPEDAQRAPAALAPVEVPGVVAAPPRSIVEGQGKAAAATEGENAPAPLAERPDRVALAGQIQDPDGNPVEASGATVTLESDDGSRATQEIHDSDYHFEIRSRGVYLVTYHAAGYRHDGARIEVTPELVEAERNNGRNDGRAGTVLGLDLIVWSEDWVEVHLTTADGRSYTTLAAELGWEVSDFAAYSFQCVAVLDPPADVDVYAGLAGLTQVGEYHQFDGGNRASLPSACLGAVLLSAPRPVWIGLTYCDRLFLGWQQVLPRDRAALFTLDLEDLLGQCGSLAFRVVERGTGRALPEANVLLLAEKSPLRRPEHHQAHPDSTGLMRFDRLVPDEYDLVVSLRPGAAHSARVRIENGQAVDLGTIELDSGPGIQVVVRDEAGAGVWALLTTGEYAPGRWIDDVMTPLSESTDAEGRAILPMPFKPLVVRAQRSWIGSAGRDGGQERSANVLVDPATWGGRTLELVLASPREVRVALGPEASQADGLGVYDAIELLVDSHGLGGETEVEFGLVPGRYAVRAFDDEGRVIAEHAFEVENVRVEVALP